MTTMATMKRKHSLTPSQIYIKFHTKGQFTGFLLFSTLCQTFKNKLQGMLKDRKHSLKRANIRTALTYRDMLGLSDQELKTTMIDKLRALMKKKRAICKNR